MKPTHKYVEIKNYIQDNIRTGKYFAGEKIESENILMAKFKVSRMTVRQAIMELQNENILISLKGKGTYIQMDDMVANGAFLSSFSETMQIKGKLASSKIISFSQVMSTTEQNELFEFKKSQPLWYIKRIRYSNGLPAIYEESYLPLALIPSLNLSHLNHSLFTYLEENNIVIHNAIQETQAILPSDEIIEYLELTEQLPLVKVIQRCYDIKLNCLELSEMYYHPTNYANTRTVLRKKIDAQLTLPKLHLLFACDNGMITSIIEQKAKDLIKKENMPIITSLIELNRIDQVIDKFDIILLDPRYRFVLNSLLTTYPQKCILVINMQQYAKMDIQSIIHDALEQYNFKQNKE